jgi:antitoxin component of RelBE/YafQ-DinJ toxin-antitoxin module
MNDQQHRTKYLQFRATSAEVLTLSWLARRMGLCNSEAIRLLIREAAVARGLPDAGLIAGYENIPAPIEMRNANPAK